MTNKIKRIINLIFSSVAVAMGIVVTVLTVIGSDISTIDCVRLLAIGVSSLGLLALNNLSKEH